MIKYWVLNIKIKDAICSLSLCHLSLISSHVSSTCLTVLPIKSSFISNGLNLILSNVSYLFIVVQQSQMSAISIDWKSLANNVFIWSIKKQTQLVWCFSQGFIAWVSVQNLTVCPLSGLKCLVALANMMAFKYLLIKTAPFALEYNKTINLI